MKVTLPASLVASGHYEEFAQGPGKRHGRSNSLKWPWLYDKLRAKGYDKSKAAAISNSRIHLRKKGRISVLPAKMAHSPAVLKKIAAADKKGKHVTKGSLRASTHVAGLAFACNDKSCAPPPVGTGGSKPSGGKSARLISNIGIVESKDYPGQFHKRDEYGEVGNTLSDRASAERWAAGRRKVVKQMITRDKMKAASKAELLPPPKGFKVITADQARGDSRPVSVEEFNRLARRGQEQLDGFAARSRPTTGLDENWDTIKIKAYEAAQESWGGATISAHTGRALGTAQRVYALTVKGQGQETVSVSEKASREEFDAAMDEAKSRFGDILQRESHYLGVFHDDDNGRIDIDPVLVVSKSSDVETIGAATHAIGGAYKFSDGLGYWPPHVDTSPTATRKRDDYERTYEE
jgi:hypothetical protein